MTSSRREKMGNSKTFFINYSNVKKERKKEKGANVPKIEMRLINDVILIIVIMV